VIVAARRNLGGGALVEPAPRPGRFKNPCLGPDEGYVKEAGNGGFPDPPRGEPVRLVRARHDACGASTRVRLPRVVPARAVRRVVCDRCREPFEPRDVEEVARRAFRRLRLPAALRDPRSLTWRIGGAVIAGGAVIIALLAINGSGDQTPATSGPRASAPPPSGRAARSGGARIVHGDNFTLALPAGWSQTEPPTGAAFAAASDGGGADATLWIERDPALDFSAFKSRSLDQLRSLAGNAHVVDRVAAPTPDATVVTLAADTPAGQPQYEVTLRVAGPFRYYLATTVESDASSDAAGGAALVHNSFVPVAGTATGGG